MVEDLLVRLQEKLVAECYRPMTRIQRLLAEIDQLSPEERRELLATLELNRKTGSRQILGDEEQALRWTKETGKAISAEDREALNRACEEIRLKLVLAAMTAEPVRESTRREIELDKLYSLDEASRGIVGLPIVHNRGGVISSRYGHYYTVVLLPRIADERHEEDIATGLLEVYDRMGSQHSWIVDFSLAEMIPFGLLGNIIGYRHLLKGRGGDLFIAWLQDSALSSSMLDRMRNVLPLKKIGDFWFSTGTQ